MYLKLKFANANMARKEKVAAIIHQTTSTPIGAKDILQFKNKIGGGNGGSSYTISQLPIHYRIDFRL